MKRYGNTTVPQKKAMPTANGVEPTSLIHMNRDVRPDAWSASEHVEDSAAIPWRRCSRFVVTVVGLLTVSCAAAGRQTGSVGSEVGPAATAATVPAPALPLVEGPGPDHVGVATIALTDAARNRQLTVYVWFPIDDPGAAPRQVYEFGRGITYPSPIAVTAPPSSISKNGPFPLIVLSHGAGSTGLDYSGYAEELASYGYIVAAPDHLGDSRLDPPSVATSRAQTRLNRPRDVTAIITEMLNSDDEQTASFAANIDAGKIAVMGHSRGGLTAFAVAAGYSNELGEYHADARVKAIVALAPGADPSDLSDTQLAAINVPTMLIVGTNDNVNTIKPHVTRPWELVSGRPLYRVELVAARHLTFGQFCHYLDYWVADGACDPGAMPIDRADVLTDTFVVRFLQSVFRGGPPLESTITPVPDDVILMVK